MSIYPQRISKSEGKGRLERYDEDEALVALLRHRGKVLDLGEIHTREVVHSRE